MHQRWQLLRFSYRTVQRPLLIVLSISVLCLLPLFMVSRSDEQVIQLLLVYGEVLIPPMLGGICANLVLNDPYREVLLTLPHRFWRVVLGRFAIVIIVTMLLWGIMIALGCVLQPQVVPSSAQIAVGGAVTFVAFACLGLWAALRLRSTVGGGVFVAALWTAPLLLREVLLTSLPGLLLHPFLTLQAPDSPFWLFNRLLLSGIALLLLLLALRLTTDAEALLPSESLREEL